MVMGIGVLISRHVLLHIRAKHARLDTNSIVLTEHVPATLEKVGDFETSEIQLNPPKQLRDQMDSLTSPGSLEHVTIEGQIHNSSKDGGVAWHCDGLRSYWKELPSRGGAFAKQGYSTDVEPSPTTHTPNHWQSEAHILVMDFGSGITYLVRAECDIEIARVDQWNVKAVRATVKWHSPVILKAVSSGATRPTGPRAG